MKTSKWPIITALTAHVLVSACSSTSGGAAVGKPNPVDVKQSLARNDLANAIYRIDSLGEFRLDEGAFKRPYGEGMTQKDQVTLERSAFGDLDQDGLGDAVVILDQQSGGSGNFKYLMAMRNTGGAPEQQASVLLGDRARITDLSIAQGYVYLNMLTARAGDPACCLSRQVRQVYRLHGGKWERSAEKIADPKITLVPRESITGIVWQWERFEDTRKPYRAVIDTPDKYTLIFLPDGSYRVKADCNRMQGQYTLEDGRIKIMPGPATLAECEPGSRYMDYLRDLTDAVSVEIRDNKLVLNLVMEGEILVFKKGGVAPDNSRNRPKVH
ncbi:META domain-containing protein [Methylomicrobium sp. RS1]|uniref:META domain-containing protein n=1 Tax=Candidatus Methylomicrobium oryzae TaxID=2802053 RepID=UPI00192516A5|nr:META domain-containing protein [Methylomicrobium sp. RS1]MBL1265232.1 META domain-containing protein [Methylomicrobium sp. RS1]